MGVPSSPLVTIGLPVRNGAEFIGEAITSVRNQTVDRWRLVIADNASTDATLAEIERAVAGDPRVQVIRRGCDIGASANFSAVLAGATTPFVKWLAADDRIGPTFLADSLDALAEDRALVGACPSVKLIDSSGRPCAVAAPLDYDYRQDSSLARLRVLLAEDPFVFALYGVLRTDALSRTKGFRPCYGADKVLVAELLVQGGLACLPTAQMESRCHPGQSLHLELDEAAAWAEGTAARPLWGRALRDRLRTVAGYYALAARPELGIKDRLGIVGLVSRFATDGAGRLRREAQRQLLRDVSTAGTRVT